jgi:UDP-3-O-[3-hydroxymyristoyl] glucosamine N-acyltransferase
VSTPTSGAGVRIHSTADVSPGAQSGAGTRVWHQAQERESAVIGRDWILGRGVYVDFGAIIRDNAKIQNYTLIYHGATLKDGLTMTAPLPD